MRHLALYPLLLCPLSVAALDLTPLRGVRELEGFKIPVLIFSAGDKVVRYQPPSGWKIVGGGAELDFVPQEDQDASMRWNVIARRPEDAGKDTVESLSKAAEATLPEAAQGIALSATNPSPFTLNGHTSIEFIFEYQLGERRFKKSVSYCNLSASERLVVAINSPVDSFASVRETAIASLFSWMEG